MKKVKTLKEAQRVFDLLGIKEVGKRWQHLKGTWVYELPFKSSYANGSTDINRFSVYKNGYVRKIIVGKSGGSIGCWQLNKVRKEPEYFKDYKWNENFTKQTWTGKYRKHDRSKRILIDRHDDRVVYLCNYLLKNIYNTSKWSLVGDYTRERMKEYHHSHYKRQDHQLPFTEECESETFTKDEVKVIINGHRYNLS